MIRQVNLDTDEYRGLSSDVKPTKVGNGSTMLEIDTGKRYMYDAEHDEWHVMPSEGGSGSGAVDSVNGKTGDVVLNASDVGAMEGITILSYGKSTWADFIAAYTANRVVYCRASSNANPASGAQTRLAFMAYVNNETNPTEVEFQYYRSVSTHSATQQGDQVYVYKLSKTAGWTVLVRETYTKIAVGTGLTSSYSNGVLTISLA